MEIIVTRAQLQTLVENEPKRRKRVGDMVSRIYNEVITRAKSGLYYGEFTAISEDILVEVSKLLSAMFPDSRVMHGKFPSTKEPFIYIDWS